VRGSNEILERIDELRHALNRPDDRSMTSNDLLSEELRALEWVME